MQTPVWQVFTDDGCDEDYLDAYPNNWPNYWLLPDGDQTGKGFVLDFGCLIEIEGFELRNTKNSNARDRYVLLHCTTVLQFHEAHCLHLYVESHVFIFAKLQCHAPVQD